jgi:predicted metal-dependent HD superfamily phosphohydrolase
MKSYISKGNTNKITEEVRFELRRRFNLLWSRCRLDGTLVNSEDQTFLDLAVLYSESNRYYHGWYHLLDCLDQFDATKDLMENPDTVEMALWVHDAVYTPGAPDNEERSVIMFSSCVGDSFPHVIVDKVSQYILYTKHNRKPGELDGCFVVDIDLASFSKPWDMYLEDTNNLRRESSHILDIDFNLNQLRFLKALSGRKTIYYSNYYIFNYEWIARKNINNLITSLNSAFPASIFIDR